MAVMRVMGHEGRGGEGSEAWALGEYGIRLSVPLSILGIGNQQQSPQRLLFKNGNGWGREISLSKAPDHPSSRPGSRSLRNASKPGQVE